MVKKSNKVKNKTEKTPRAWYLIDAKQASLGRMATKISMLLTGKNRPDYSPHDDKGGNVVVINSDKLSIFPGKLKGKLYHHYSGYPGGLRTRNLAEKLAKRGSVWVIREAVRGMLPKNRLRKDRLNRLRIYTDEKHPHQDQLK